MHDLRLVGVHEDGEHLMLSGADGEQYLLAVDEPLRAAVRRDRAHLGQLQIAMAGDLRPREVQAQIRAGATAEEVAERSGWPLDRVRRYEGAVLAEREHITQLGRAVTLRRRGSDPTPPTLGVRVEQRLSARGVDVRDNVWDSWRPADGLWVLTLRFTAGGREREAHWQFDPTTRTVTPNDDEALWLSEDEKPPAAPLAAPHLSAVPTVSAVAPPPLASDQQFYDLDAEGGLHPPAASHATPSAVDLVGAMRERRQGRRRHPAGRNTADSTAADGADSSTAATGEQEHLELEPLTLDPELMGAPPAAHPFPFPERLREPAAESEPGAGAEPDDAAPPADRVSDPASGSPRGSARSARRPAAETPAPPRNFAPPRVPRPSAPPVLPPSPALSAPADPIHAQRRARRASVPSWDEIMFGGKRD